MKQAILRVAAICMIAALARELLGDSRMFGALRMLLGLEILSAALDLLDRLRAALG